MSNFAANYSGAEHRVLSSTFDTPSGQTEVHKNHPQTHQPYPATTAHFGKCAYVGESDSNCAGSVVSKQLFPALIIPSSTRAASPLPFINRTSPQPAMPDFVNKKIHDNVVNENLKLTHELAASQQETELAKKACRDLAAWAYNERERLMRELAATEEKTPVIKTEVEED
ncbi:hypothetical protein PTMSG1_09716 [Pyrenophora teres f. maculata]|nr:hypothetical protein PTMSG1_09716 [Pyrenophora teres f. maculata]